MQNLFAGHEEPFYGQADLVTVGALPPATVHDLVVDGFRSTDRDPENLPSTIAGFCHGHPRRTM